MARKTKSKKKRPCPCCGRTFLKGRYVVRLLDSGAVRQRVCGRCADRAVPVLASDAPARCEQCGTNLARFCGGCIGRVIDAQTGLNVAQALARASLDDDGRR